ncbi:T9SS type A sorting domain-containing protein, partial [Seonamhaeicola marinus]
GIVTSNGLCASLDVAGAPIMVEESEACQADSGTMYSRYPISCFDGSTTITAKAYDQAYIPNGYQQIFVLTEGFSLTILDVSSEPTFTVDNSGFFRIHSLVYNPDTLDLSVVQFGVTTGYDVVNLVTNNNICASLDVHGAINIVIRSRYFCKYLGDLFNNRSYGVTLAELPSNLNAILSNEDIADNRSLEMRLYPNPINDVISIKFKASSNEEIQYNITDLGGRQVQSGKLEFLRSDVGKINASQLVNGVYLLRLNSQFSQITKRIVVNK